MTTQGPPPIPEESIEKAVNEDILEGIQSNYDEKAPIEPIVYFCKDCRKLIPTPKSISKKKKLTFSCPYCKEKSVAWGTKKSIYSFFHLDEEGTAEERKKKERGTKVAQLKEAKEERLREQEKKAVKTKEAK